MTSPQPNRSTQAATDYGARLTAIFDQLEGAVGELKQQVLTASDPNTIGRDVQQVRTLFDTIYSCEHRLAQAMDFTWTPSERWSES